MQISLSRISSARLPAVPGRELPMELQKRRPPPVSAPLAGHHPEYAQAWVRMTHYWGVLCILEREKHRLTHTDTCEHTGAHTHTRAHVHATHACYTGRPPLGGKEKIERAHYMQQQWKAPSLSHGSSQDPCLWERRCIGCEWEGEQRRTGSCSVDNRGCERHQPVLTKDAGACIPWLAILTTIFTPFQSRD